MFLVKGTRALRSQDMNLFSSPEVMADSAPIHGNYRGFVSHPSHSIRGILLMLAFVICIQRYYTKRPSFRDPRLAVIPKDTFHGARVLDVVHVDTILRSAHLLPVFGEDPVPPYLSYADALDSFQAYYVNRYIDHHAHFTVF